MSTKANNQHSAIPRPARAAAPAMIGPRPTKASLFRASQIKEGRTVEKGRVAVIQQSPAIEKATTPANSAMGREGTERKGILKKRNQGLAAGKRGKAMHGVAAPVARFPRKKRVHYDEVLIVDVYELQAGERVPWRSTNREAYELCEGEISWEEWRAQQQYTLEKSEAMGIAEMLRKTGSDLAKIMKREEAEEAETRAIGDWLRHAAWDIFEGEMIRYKEEVDELDAADPARDEDSTWSIYIYGGNPMLGDEEMPFSMEDDVFDDILSDMMIQQVLAKARNAQAQWGGEKTVAKKEVKAKEGLTRTADPDTTLDFADMAHLLHDQTEWISAETEPQVCSALAEYNSPLPNAQDLLNFERNLNDLAVEGIPISETDEDLWSRLRRGLTDLVSTKEEAFFGPPETFSFEEKFKSMQDDEMLGDVTFPGQVFLVLEALGADDTLLDIETGDEDQWRMREYEFLTEIAWSSGPGSLCAALEE